VAASDYPHTDPSQEESLVESFMGREEVPLRIREKILSHNPKRLYNL
jgi:predicted TIM-barrel fold metal-dependent hydrolase